MGYPYVYTSLAVLVTAGGLYAHRKMKFIRLQSFRESILWSFREWRAGYPVPALMDNWVNIDGSDDEYYQRWQHMRSVWYFLKPFFAARGYRLYEGRPKPCHPCELFPVPATPGVSGLPHPFARGGFKTDFEALFTFVVRSNYQSHAVFVSLTLDYSQPLCGPREIRKGGMWLSSMVCFICAQCSVADATKDGFRWSATQRRAKDQPVVKFSRGTC